MNASNPWTVGRVLRALRTPVTLLVLLAVLGYAAWWGYERVTEPIPPPPPVPCETQGIEDDALQAEQVSVRVYNGGDERGLAGDVAQSLRAAGFLVRTVDNTEEEITTTVIVVQDKDNPEAELIAGFFEDAEIREDPSRINRMVDVLVGNEYGDFNTEAKTSIGLEDSTICLPALPSEDPF